MKSLVILGANGYIGGKLIESLSRGDYSIKALVYGDFIKPETESNVKFYRGDIMNRSDLREIIAPEDTVICLAGTTTATKEEEAHFKVNVAGQSIVASLCAERKAKVIYFSTSHLCSDTSASDIYSFSKKLGEEIYEFYSTYKKLNAIVFRLGSVYGPDHKKGVVFTMLQSLADSGVIEIPQMEVIRNFIFIDDVIDAVSKAIEYSHDGFHLFNITAGKGTSLSEIAKNLIHIMNEKGHKGALRTVNKIVNPATMSVSTDDAIEKLGFNPKTSLIDGLRKTVAAYKLR